MWTVKMENGTGHVEWYETLSVRTQASDKASARHFTSEEAAQAQADFCERHPDAFSGAFWDGCKWTLKATVEPV